MGKVLRPKNASRPLAMALLDERGCPVPQLLGQVRAGLCGGWEGGGRGRFSAGGVHLLQKHHLACEAGRARAHA